MTQKTFVYDGINVIYYEEGNGFPVVLLHGWGCSHETMEPIFQHLVPKFRVYNFDLPGHGASDEPRKPWSTVEYKEMLKAFFAANNIEHPILIAHSFGGRLSLRLGAEGIPHKMVLTGCAGLKPKRGLDYYAKVYSYKAAKKAFDELGVKKLPTVKSLQEEFAEKLAEKKGAYAELKKVRDELRDLTVHTANYEELRDLAERDPRKEKEHGRE